MKSEEQDPIAGSRPAKETLALLPKEAASDPPRALVSTQTSRRAYLLGILSFSKVSDSKTRPYYGFLKSTACADSFRTLLRTVLVFTCISKFVCF